MFESWVLNSVILIFGVLVFFGEACSLYYGNHLRTFKTQNNIPEEGDLSKEEREDYHLVKFIYIALLFYYFYIFAAQSEVRAGFFSVFFGIIFIGDSFKESVPVLFNIIIGKPSKNRIPVEKIKIQLKTSVISDLVHPYYFLAICFIWYFEMYKISLGK